MVWKWKKQQKKELKNETGNKKNSDLYRKVWD